MRVPSTSSRRLVIASWKCALSTNHVGVGVGGSGLEGLEVFCFNAAENLPDFLGREVEEVEEEAGCWPPLPEDDDR